ncbi:hypothetical protein J3F84DRAFT_156739 [Trichoderma pleuroticola]
MASSLRFYSPCPFFCFLLLLFLGPQSRRWPAAYCGHSFTTPIVLIEASTACKCFTSLFIFFGLSNGVVVTYTLMVGCFSCFAPRTKWTMGNGQWAQFVAWSLRDFVFFCCLLVCFSSTGGVCVWPVYFSLFSNVCMNGTSC